MLPNELQTTLAPLDVSKITFGSQFTPNMLSASYSDGKWSGYTIHPLRYFELHPGAIVLHYSQSIFEGLKAYQQRSGGIALFRPEMNVQRLNRSAARMEMPGIDEPQFLAPLTRYVDHARNHIPIKPGSLYLRPTMFATEPALEVRASSMFELFVIACPIGSYFGGSPHSKSISLFVSECVGRAAPGGTGAVKAGANYAVTLQVTRRAKSLGCAPILFLNAGGPRTVEEAGGMSMFFVRKDVLLTPPLSDTILGGVTRDSILLLAPALNLKVLEQPIQIDEAIAEIADGTITEAFVCGTAAVVVPVEALHFEGGKIVTIDNRNTPVADLLFDRLQGIQYGDYADEFGWRRTISGNDLADSP